MTQIVAQTSAERAKHVRDVDALARLLGPTDREQAHLTRKERSVLERMAESPDLERARATFDRVAQGPLPHPD